MAKLRSRWIPLFISWAILFGILMALNYGVSNLWLRAAIASVAGGLFGFGFCWAFSRRRRNQPSE